MNVSRGRCLLAPLRLSRNWTQAELSRRTGYDKDKGTGYSDRMISHFESYDGKGNGKPMSPEAMFVFSRLFCVPMQSLYEWHVNGAAD